MKSIWSGAISFGLVNIPVNLYSAIENKGGLSFDMLDKETHSPIHYKRIRETDGKEIKYKDIVKGYEYSKDEYVVLSDKDFEKASPEKSQNIEIESFVNEKDIETIYFYKPYYLEPAKNAARPYALLREALKKAGKAGVTQFVLRNREHLAVIKPMDNALVLNILRFKNEVRDYQSLDIPAETKVAKEELDLAIKLIDQLSGEFKIEKYTDDYTSQLMQVIEARLKGKVPAKKAEKKEPARAKDLMEALKESLEAGKKKKEKEYA